MSLPNRATKVAPIVGVGVVLGLVGGAFLVGSLTPPLALQPTVAPTLAPEETEIREPRQFTGSINIPGLTKDLLITRRRPFQRFTELYLWENDAPFPRLLSTGEPVDAWMYSSNTNQVLALRNDPIKGTSSLSLGPIDQPLTEIATGLSGYFPPSFIPQAPSAQFTLRSLEGVIQFATAAIDVSEFTTAPIPDPDGHLAAFLGDDTLHFAPSISPACFDFTLDDGWFVCSDATDSEVEVFHVGQGVDGPLRFAFYRREGLYYQIGEDPSINFIPSLGGSVTNIWIVEAEAGG